MEERLIDISTKPPTKLVNESPISLPATNPSNSTATNAQFVTQNQKFQPKGPNQQIVQSIDNIKAQTSFSVTADIQTYTSTAELIEPEQEPELRGVRSMMRNFNKTQKTLETLETPLQLGNFLNKKFSIKITNNFYSSFSFRVSFIYDENNFNYGTIFTTNLENKPKVLNTSGYSTDGKYRYLVIYADGLYSYLIKNITSGTNIIDVDIVDGIRTTNIPADPTGKYSPDNNDELIYFPAFYFGSFNSNFVNNSVTTIQEYNIYTKINLQADLNPTTITGDTLFFGCVTPNLNFAENYDVLFFNCFSVQKKFSLSLGGNILGVFIKANQTLTNNGAFNKINDTLAVIIYADGDFEYLNEITTPFTYKFNVDPTTGSVIINLPVKPSDYIPPFLSKLPNQDQGGVYTWNDFYVGKLNNSIIYDSNQQVQNYTLGTGEVYDSYDFTNNIPGNIIGNAIAYTNVSKTSESSVLHFTFINYNFYNGTNLLTCYVSTLTLSKVGGLPNNIKINPNVFSSSQNYLANNNILYNIELTTGSVVDQVRTQTILPTAK